MVTKAGWPWGFANGERLRLRINHIACDTKNILDLDNDTPNHQKSSSAPKRLIWGYSVDELKYNGDNEN